MFFLVYDYLYFSYYAAPSTVYNVSQYDSAVSQYEEPVNNTDATRQILRRRVDAGWQEEEFTEASHYIEIEWFNLVINKPGSDNSVMEFYDSVKTFYINF